MFLLIASEQMSRPICIDRQTDRQTHSARRALTAATEEKTDTDFAESYMVMWSETRQFCGVDKFQLGRTSSHVYWAHLSQVGWWLRRWNFEGTVFNIIGVYTYSVWTFLFQIIFFLSALRIDAGWDLLKANASTFFTLVFLLYWMYRSAWCTQPAVVFPACHVIKCTIIDEPDNKSSCSLSEHFADAVKVFLSTQSWQLWSVVPIIWFSKKMDAVSHLYCLSSHLTTDNEASHYKPLHINSSLLMLLGKHFVVVA
jgi:hypothetical protein